ncbi:ATP-binding protein [Bradyrhizobium sp. AT1]|uniref:HD domain-containing protein n=1 Tax=Bradyrhizobium sp. AT1 TaxID=574934 RepID=UPI0018DDBBF6|nr:ATP-binding protein [Bradyrhizobium sp. AT1]
MKHPLSLMKIPQFITGRIQAEHKLSSFVSSAIDRINSHISANRMVFFPEYTDHGITHLELVLQTALDLATEEAQALLTTSDAAVLAVAVGLHDFGMHLTREGFESLITPGCLWRGVPYFDQKPWDILWQEFYADATRFDGRKLRSLFGEGYRPVRPLPMPGEQWEDFDYLLVGEFLRKFHPRLAHEIALYGLPGKAGLSISICQTGSAEQEFLADVSGLIARSHGMDLRPCLAYLEQSYNNKIAPRGVHAAFLAVLLRIADYFQIQASRAPTARTEVNSFQSQLSAREWKVHQSISDIHNTGNDPEAIFVIAQPGDVDSFLKLKGWLAGVQSELDQSWAILGEVYGLQKHVRLDELGLKIRRVKSNLDDIEQFSKTVSYVPAKISFEAANADLLKLLVEPLYGDDPAIAIRELIQNAVDAVREFDSLLTQHPQLQSVSRYPIDGDVLLEVEGSKEGVTAVRFTDRGVGMTAQIIQEYFLRAGASFRRSAAWRHDHEDSTGHSKILRTGRFGIGALAAFLLGDEIELTTRHALSAPDDGISFRAKLDDESISLSRVLAPVGTCITIRTPPRLKGRIAKVAPTNDKLGFGNAFGHYFLRKPSVSRTIFGEAAEVNSWLPQPEDGMSADWRYFANKDFQKVFWTFRRSYPELSSNGIVIKTGSAYDYQRSATSLTSNFQIPYLAVFDRDGLLPVNLQRTALRTRQLPFEEDLIRSVTDDLIAHALIEAPERCTSDWLSGKYEGFKKGVRSWRAWPTWVLTKDGFLLGNAPLIEALSPRILLLAVGGAAAYQGWADEVRAHTTKDGLIAAIEAGVFHQDRMGVSTGVKGTFTQVMNGFFFFDGFQLRHSATLIPTVLAERIGQLRPGKALRRDLAKIGKATIIDGWASIQRPGFSLTQLRDAICQLPINSEDPVAFCLFELSGTQEQRSAQDNSCATRWLEVLQSPVVPFDTGERAKLEQRASDQIAEVLSNRRQNPQTRIKNEESSSSDPESI